MYFSYILIINFAIVIQQIDFQNVYKGIEGENWYFNYLNSDKDFETYFEAEIEKSWEDNRYVDCCFDIAYIQNYIMESKHINIKFRLLLCETTRLFPRISVDLLIKTWFLGYDYAYAGGSYYSCINNDVLPNRIPELVDLKLNENGLFNTEEEIEKFIKMRDVLKSSYPQGTFESGEFIIYKLSEIESVENRLEKF